MSSLQAAPVDTHPRTSTRPRPRLFPDELRNKPQPFNAPEPPWRRAQPANPERALHEIADKIFSEKERAEIQRLEDELGKIEADRKQHCDRGVFDQKLFDAQQDSKLTPQELAALPRELELEKQAIPEWRFALDRRDAELKEQLRPFALRLACELPGAIAKAVNEQEKAAGPDGVMAYWGIGQDRDASVLVYPLRRLHELSLSWLESIEANDGPAKESLIRCLLADSGVLKPKVFLFRR